MLKQYIKETQQVVVKNTVVRAERICDECGKKIDKDYWHVETFHDDWGNDSIDSTEYWDYCSPECLKKAFNAYICRSDNGYNSQHIEVDHLNAPTTKLERTEIMHSNLDPGSIKHIYEEDHELGKSEG